MAANYVLLASQTVGEAGASSVTFSNIPQTGYTDLKVVCSTRTVSAATIDNLVVKPNGATANQTVRRLQGTGAAAASSTDTSFPPANNGATSTASTFSSTEIYIPNYTSSNYKSLSIDSVQEDNTTTAYAQLWAGLWSNVTAISSLVISTSSASNFSQYSSFYLYGISASGVTPVIAPFATGGNVTNDGTYWYHSFLASSTFTPLKTLSCDYLVVAGGAGGGGGNNGNGGGGAGGLRELSAQSFTASSYTVTVGNGGAASTSATAKGGSGNTSSLVGTGISTSASGGGGGGSSGDAGSQAAMVGAAGGSGGGAAAGSASPYIYKTGGAGNTGSYSPVEGYAGGGSNQSSQGGGGGGAGAIGIAGGLSGGVGAGAGAIGRTSTLINAMGVATSTGVLNNGNYYYAGGGGGGCGAAGGNVPGAGGIGGGGGGAQAFVDGVAGTANTGSGGGGACANANAGAGGKGIIIIRYAMV